MLNDALGGFGLRRRRWRRIFHDLAGITMRSWHRDILVGKTYVMSSETEAVVIWLDLIAEGKNAPYQRIVNAELSAISAYVEARIRLRTYTQIWLETRTRA